jgi:hypothetical protein
VADTIKEQFCLEWFPDLPRLTAMTNNDQPSSIHKNDGLLHLVEYIKSKAPQIQKQETLLTMAEAGFRSAWYHGIACDGNDCLDTRGPHPEHFIPDNGQRKKCWNLDVQGLLDKVSESTHINESL